MAGTPAQPKQSWLDALDGLLTKQEAGALSEIEQLALDLIMKILGSL